VGPATIDTHLDEAGCVQVRHAAGPAAIGIRIDDARPIEDAGWAEIQDGGFDLLPGEERSVRVGWAGAPVEGRQLMVSGWNVEDQVLR
jgi:beta-mannosidase